MEKKAYANLKSPTIKDFNMKLVEQEQASNGAVNSS
jgi:hypothetical protein